MKKNYPHNIDFEKEMYTIPELISILASEGDIPDCDNKASSNYRMIYQGLRRALDEEVDESERGGSQRKQTFPREAIIRVVNKKVTWLRQLSKQSEQLKDWAVEARKYQKEMQRYLATHGPEEHSKEVYADGGYGEYVKERVTEIKLQIFTDFILKYFIDFDQACLEHDLGLNFTFDDLHPTPEGMEAVNRLKDIRNYYEITPEFAKIMVMIRSLIEE